LGPEISHYTRTTRGPVGDCPLSGCRPARSPVSVMTPSATRRESPAAPLPHGGIGGCLRALRPHGSHGKAHNRPVCRQPRGTVVVGGFRLTSVQPGLSWSSRRGDTGLTRSGGNHRGESTAHLGESLALCSPQLHAPVSPPPEGLSAWPVMVTRSRMWGASVSRRGPRVVGGWCAPLTGRFGRSGPSPSPGGEATAPGAEDRASRPLGPGVCGCGDRLPRVTGWRCPIRLTQMAVNGNLCDVGRSESVHDVRIRGCETDIGSDLVKGI
jgi:hypothetical protein